MARGRGQAPRPYPPHAPRPPPSLPAQTLTTHPPPCIFPAPHPVPPPQLKAYPAAGAADKAPAAGAAAAAGGTSGTTSGAEEVALEQLNNQQLVDILRKSEHPAAAVLLQVCGGRSPWGGSGGRRPLGTDAACVAHKRAYTTPGPSGPAQGGMSLLGLPRNACGQCRPWLHWYAVHPERQARGMRKGAAGRGAPASRRTQALARLIAPRHLLLSPCRRWAQRSWRSCRRPCCST